MLANRADDPSVASLADEWNAAVDHIEWRRVTLAAGSHGVLPLVYRQLKAAGIAPDDLTPMRSEFYDMRSTTCISPANSRGWWDC